MTRSGSPSVMSTSGQIGRRRVREVVEPPRLFVALEIEPPVRDVVPREEGLELVAALGPAMARRSRTGARSSGWCVCQSSSRSSSDGIQLLLRRIPRLHQVVVELDVVDRPDRDIGVGVRGEQHAASPRAPALGAAREQLDAGHRRHALIGDDEGDGALLRAQRPQDVQGCIARWHGVDLEVLRVMAVEVAPNCSEDGRIVVNRHDRRLGHGAT